MNTSEYKVISTSRTSFDVQKASEDGEYDENIVISSTDTVRTVLRAKIVKNTNNPEAKAQLKILYQRKKPSAEWEDVESINLSKLKGGEGVRLSLDSAVTLRLYEELRRIYELAESGMAAYGAQELIVGHVQEIVRTEAGRAEIIRKLVEDEHAGEVFKFLAQEDPSLATRIAYAQIQAERGKALSEFETNLNEDTSESKWQNFFEKNMWIFGYGLKYRVLRHEQQQPSYGGTRLDGTGEQRGDFLAASEGDVSFTVLVEIKKADTPLVRGSNPQRSGAWSLSKDLTDGITQLQANQNTWEQIGAQNPENRDRLETSYTFTVAPKGILVIGRLRDLADDRKKRDTFERFRQGFNRVEILTFDELYKRAKFIVSNSSTEEKL